MSRTSRIRFVTTVPLRGEGTWFFTFGPGYGLVHTGRWSQARRRAALRAVALGTDTVGVRVAR